jgi:hypothetical protein
MKEDENGWWDADAGTHWVCAECKNSSPIAEWEECDYPCDDCGDHDGRRCPECGCVFDHVWGSRKLKCPNDGVIKGNAAKPDNA